MGAAETATTDKHQTVYAWIAELLNKTAKATVNFSFSLKDGKHTLVILPSAVKKLGLQLKNLAIELPASVKFSDGIKAIVIEHQNPVMVYATLVALLSYAGVQVVIN